MGELLTVGRGWMGCPDPGRTHARGLDVSVLDTSAALGWEETKAALGPGDREYQVTATDDEGWQAAATAALPAVAGVLGFSESHIGAAAMLAEELSLGPGVRAAVVSRNKLMRHEVFAGRASISSSTCPLGTRGRLSRSLPLSSIGSLGVRSAADQQEPRARANARMPRSWSRSTWTVRSSGSATVNSRSSARDNSSGRPAICSRSRSTWPSTSVGLASNALINDGTAHSPSLSTPTSHSGLAPATVETDTTSYIPNPCESPQRAPAQDLQPFSAGSAAPSPPAY